MRWMFAPISAIYSAGSFFRWKFYRWGVKKARRAPAPVVSIGNIALGGTGKTPCTIWLAKTLADDGYYPAILTRGYGRSIRERLIVEGDIPTARLAGDEPALMASRLTNIPIAIDPDRYGSAREIGGGDGRVFILDDGFQHLKLARDFDLVLLPSNDPFSGGHFFPWGRLRDGLWRLREADAIIIVGDGDKRPAELKYLAADVPVFRARKVLRGVKTLCGKKLSVKVLEDKPVIAFAAIASPDSFERTLQDVGADIRGRLWFRDHRRFEIGDIRRIEETAERCDADILVTTEKDAVRLAGLESRLEIYIVSIDFVVEGGDELLKLIYEKIAIT